MHVIHDGGARAAPGRLRKIESETPILPHVIADTAVRHYAHWLSNTGGGPVADRWVAEGRDIADGLAARAGALYNSNADFRIRIQRRGPDGREALLSFMLHWCATRLSREAPELAAQLPPNLRRLSF